ncbi:omptin family outer membrane protease [Escherichia coli]|uniref:omptin family outer membrane protease n=1 Tax=Escherichia coli TaxID=562 RepID=UPI003EEF2D17
MSIDARQTTFRSKVINQNYYSVAVNAGYDMYPRGKSVHRGCMESSQQIKKGIHLFTTVVIILRSIIITGLELKITNFMTTAGLKYTF